ncbi:MAG: energy transducer TonB [Roseovarius sp.]|nr:energy transducer TonB [Roseovarius sp.]
MNAGQAISGAAHVGLIAWVLVGGSFPAQKVPPPLELTEVTTITSREFEELLAGDVQPEAVAEIADINSPEAGETPLLPEETEDLPLVALPESANAPDLETVPEVETVVAPDAEVDDEMPILELAHNEASHDSPEISTKPQARPAEKIAPEPVAMPEPETKLAEVERDAVAPDVDALLELPEVEATASEEAAAEIVTEAEEASEITSAPPKAIRPVSRPVQPEIDLEPELDSSPDPVIQPEPSEGQPGRSQPVENVSPSGAPLTASEIDSFRRQIQRCWNTGSLSSESLEITVVIEASLNESGRPDEGSVRLLSHDGKSESAAQKAFQAGRRAIIRCGLSGYDLPVEKYDRWRKIEITFNPEKMRIK